MAQLELSAYEEVLTEWNRVRAPEFRVRPIDLQWNMGEQRLVNYRAIRINDTPVICGVASAEGIRAGLPEKNLWLSLWGEIEKGGESAFVEGLRAVAVLESKTKIVIGGDEFHFLPGIPQLCEGLVTACKGASFEGTDVADLSGDLWSAAVKDYILRALSDAKAHNVVLQKAESREQIESLERFLRANFPGRWLREFQFWKSRTDAGRAYWLALKRVDRDETLGFARLALRKRLQPVDSGWNPGALRLPLEPRAEWADLDSCLGPIGVAPQHRGSGLGRVLLGLALQSLREHDAGRVCIDWTDAFKYYEPLGFQKIRQYWSAWTSGIC